MEKIYTDVADMIFERRAFKFGAFKLKLHEKNPNAPLSPFYLNLRTKNNPTNQGPLIDDDCDMIAELMYKRAVKDKLYFNAIAGLPYAADPFIESIERNVLIYDFRIIKLAKEINEDGRRIVLMPGFDYIKNEIVLLLDDLVTKADSKIEAIRAIESEGSIVRDLIVLVNREQGGKEQLKKAGYNLISCFTIRELLSYYKSSGKISQKKYQECIDYIINN
jgi:orotate phosphoribosyltransferase